MMAFAVYTFLASQAMRLLHRWIGPVLLFLSSALFLASMPVAAAGPIAGTVITANALATYTPAGTTVPETTYSNTVIAIVQAVEAFTFEPNNKLQRPAGSIVTFAHQLHNRGNVASTYTFFFDTTGCATPNFGFLGTLSLYLDANGNGIVDTTEAKLPFATNGVLKLEPGVLASLLLQAQVPLGADGSVSCVRLLVRSDASELQVARTDTVTITSNASVVLTKSVSSSGLALPGVSQLSYTIVANNIGNSDALPSSSTLAPTPTTIMVDGQPRALVLIRDLVPVGTQYVPGSLRTAVAGAVRLFRLASDAPFHYASEPEPVNGQPSGRDDASAVEVAIGLPGSLVRQGTVSMEFKAHVLANAPDLVSNMAWSNFNDGSADKEVASNPSVVKVTRAILGVSKAAGVAVRNVDSSGALDDTATVRFQLQVRNFGTDTLYKVGIQDVLENRPEGLGQYTAATVPGVGQYTVVANSLSVVSQSGAGTVAALDRGFTGQADHAQLLSGSSVLPPGGSITVQFDMRANIRNVPLQTVLYNSASAHAVPSANGTERVTAESSNGTDPDANRDGIPDTPSRTPYSFNSAVLSLAKTVFPPKPVSGEPRTYDIEFALKVTNTGLVDAVGVRLSDSLVCAFEMDRGTGPIASWRLLAAPSSLNNLLTPNPGYTGAAESSATTCDRGAQANPDALASVPFEQTLALTDGLRPLGSGKSDTIKFTARVTLKPSAIGTFPTITNKSWAAISQPVSSSTGVPLGARSNGQIALLWATSSTVSAALTDPSGVVYNAVTRQAIAGATVTMKRLSCQASSVGPITAAELFGDTSIYTFSPGDNSVSVTTDATGAYAFILKVPPVSDLCTYSLAVVPPAGSGLNAPSSLLPAQSGVFSNCGLVTPIVGAPPVGSDTTYYNRIAAGRNPSTGAACEVFNNNIPLDPSGGNQLILQKTASATTAELGDLMTFTLKVTNQTAAQLPRLSFRDQLPAGFRYIPGSSRVGGVRVADPSGGVGPNLVFSLPVSAGAPLEVGQSLSLTYQVRIGVGAPIGVDAVNRAWADAGLAPSILTSNEADARVRVIGGVFATEAYAFGKVFVDCNKNGIQDESEAGIPGVRLFMEDGTGVVTDQEGKWSLYGLRPVTHALRLDTSTLPEGARLALIEPRQSRQADSLFLDLKNGEWHKANFAVQNCEHPGLLQAVQARRDAILAQPASEGETARAGVRLAPESKITAPADVRGLPSAGTIDASGNLKAATGVSSPLINLPNAVTNADFGSSSKVDLNAPVAPHTPAPATAIKPVAAMEQSDTPKQSLEESLQGQDRRLGFLNMQDHGVLSSAVQSVRVKGTKGSRLILTLNGKVIDEKRVGKRASIDSRQLEAWEYVAVQFQPGVNLLRLEEVDGFGITRGSQEIQLRAPGELATIEIEVAKTAKADERTKVPVTLRLLDQHGLLVTARTPLIVESIAARWAETDLNPLEPGLQIMVEGGTASLQLQPPATPGDGKIRVSAGTLQSEARIIFLPDLRPLTGIGVLEGVINFRNPGAMPFGAPRAADAFESELRGLSDKNGDTHGTARAAFYFKGAVKGEYLLTAAYDSDKTTATSLFRDIQPDQFYPIYGDSAVKTFDAQSSQRFYVRVDKNRSYLLYGDFNTASSSEVRKLSQVSRTGTGLQHVYNSDDVRVTSHYSRDALKQVFEEIPANGTSGPFRLTRSEGSDLFANSETVQIVVRDRNQPNVILSTTALSRFVDYSIEPLAKTILLTRPISSLDSDLNPQSIRINYLVDTGGPAFDVAGVDVQLRMSDRLQLGGIVEMDDTPNSARRLQAATALLRISEATLLSAELVGTHSDLKGDGQALGLELRHDDALLKYNLRMQSSDAGFDNPSSGVAAGRSEVRGHLDYRLGEETHLKADLVYSQDNGLTGSSGASSNAVQTQGVSVSVQSKISPKVTAEVGVRAGQTDTTAATGFDYGTVSAGTPTGTSTASGVTRDSLALRGRLTLQVNDSPTAQVFAEAEQDVNDADRHIFALGGNYAINDKARVYGRYELLSSMGSQYALTSGTQRNVGLIGVESAYMKGGRIYDEYRIADTIDGRAMQSAMGVRNTFEVTDSFRLSGSLEQVSALPGASGTSSGESRAITGAFDWLGTGAYKDRLRGSGAVEFRDGADAGSGLLTLGMAVKVNPALSLLTRASVNRVNNRSDGSVRWLEREQIGFAYRPVDQDVWNSLMRYEHKADSWDGVASSSQIPMNTVTDILSAHVNYQPDLRNILSGRIAAKQSTVTADGVRSSYGAQLLYGRWTHDINRDWDVGLQAGVLMGDGGTQQHMVGAELGYQLGQGLWLSAGYNLIGLHEPDLAGADYTDSGVYLRLRFKFDERLFNKSQSPGPEALR